MLTVDDMIKAASALPLRRDPVIVFVPERDRWMFEQGARVETDLLGREYIVVAHPPESRRRILEGID